MKVEKKYKNGGWVSTFRTVSKSTARREISSFILKNKKRGVKRLSTLDFVLNLRLPAKQVERILENFEKRGQLKEVDV